MHSRTETRTKGTADQFCDYGNRKFGLSFALLLVTQKIDTSRRIECIQEEPHPHVRKAVCPLYREDSFVGLLLEVSTGISYGLKIDVAHFARSAVGIGVAGATETHGCFV